MGIDGSRTKPMFEKTEHWSSPLSLDEALTAISKAFAADKARIRQDGTFLEIRTGSNLQYRLWGNLFSWSRRKIPVALTVRVRAAEHGVHIDAHAFDTFGIRLTDHAFFGAQETFEDRLDVLLRQAAAAAEASPKA
ncbi:hypothetical protein ASG92_21675 [Arthrobacter sp. Soil736]|uniref:hypothetical protein n=1 Tax=Arthrobacter sp. Soil736 TaxID=1736395 RepID=UPI0007155DE5|nr:hypothetical protein [Arthrobacter sp. Soil736]KRE60559.1 hypothetical protein ASG92_21675 [Arthrobacter sp. Soil736]